VSKDRPHDQLDETIHQRTRLAIMATLAGVESLDFVDLKADLALSDGNLSTHLSALERAGFVRIAKSFRGRKPRTTAAITARGRKAMDRYLRLLQQVVEKAAPGRKPRPERNTEGA
jgi:DNA-binding HxlR family transcriptional regulator